ncbi:hypothetical protein WMY93_026135 [Mugilogobius chulae]|uniref:Uncharacterized protein n=1 Tax=Mugilogobius chulae TaxID=88201 RepID=A0AAW0MXM0_9GOBI
MFHPKFRLGQSGKDPIPCTAAELHIMTLLENLKQQVNQLSAIANILLARNTSGLEPSAEMPEEIKFPLASLDELDQFEDWITSPANSAKRSKCSDPAIDMLLSVLPLRE